jgi:hypothetical protein
LAQEINAAGNENEDSEAEEDAREQIKNKRPKRVA